MLQKQAIVLVRPLRRKLLEFDNVKNEGMSGSNNLKILRTSLTYRPQSYFSFLPTIATLDAHEGWREEFLAGRDSLYQWFERCKRDVGSNYGRACGKGAGEFARLLQELAEKLSDDADTPKVSNADFTIAIAT